MVADLDEAREELIRRRLASRRRAELQVPPPAERGPLSFAQQRLWFLDQLWPGQAAYVIPAAYRIRGALDVPALSRAITAVVSRHEALRTCFPAVAGKPYQQVRAAVPGLSLTNLSDQRDPVAAARALAATRAGHAFNLAEGPLVRTELLRLGPGDHVLLVTVHHIVFDGMSLDRFAAEVSSAYAGAELPALPLQYRDFAAWQREHLSDGRLARHLEYWRQRLAGVPRTLRLPTDRPRPGSPSFSGAVIPVTVSAEVTAAVRSLARDRACSVSSVALAAYHAVLGRQAGVTDLVVGVTMAGRVRAGVENLIGFFVNTVPIRGDLTSDPPFAEFACQIHERSVAAQEHQELPFERVVEELAPSRDLAQLPLVQVLFNLVPGLDYAALTLPGADVTDFSEPARTARFELELHLMDKHGALTGELIYATDLFDQPTARRFAGHYLNFLSAACHDPGQRISRVPITSAEGPRLSAR